MTDITVLTIILNYRTPQMTLRAAEAALAAMEGLAGEVMIVDNDSQDGSHDLMAREAAARGWTRDNRLRVVASDRNGGFGAGNNVGMRMGLSCGEAPDFVYVLNSDAFPDRDALHNLVDFLRDHPRAGIAGSHVRGEDGAEHAALFRFPTIAGEFEQAIKLGLVTRALAGSVIPMAVPDTPRQADWVAGASMLMRMRMLDEVGLFDETFFLYFEETDLCKRAGRAGWQTWFVPASRVVHIGSVSTGMKVWPRTPRYWFASRRHYFLKNHGRAYLMAATLARIAGAAFWRLRCALTRRPTGEPARALRDLIAFSLGAPFRGEGPRVPAPYSQPLAEDAK
ncbi:MAG: glycosyltransferase family 2 protein [Rhodobacteraceae bacterium]|nr:MAG: glycosyltransferase family 2 protein [Paracoccaceae bacterium]